MATKGPWQSRSTEAQPSTCPPADRATLFERLKWSGTRSPACGVGRGRPPTAELSPASAVAQVALARLRPWGVVCRPCRQGLPPGGRAQQQPSAQCPRSSEGHICQARHHAGGADAAVAVEGRRSSVICAGSRPAPPAAPHRRLYYIPSQRRVPPRSNLPCRHRPTRRRRLLSLGRPLWQWARPARQPARRGHGRATARAQGHPRARPASPGPCCAESRTVAASQCKGGQRGSDRRVGSNSAAPSADQCAALGLGGGSACAVRDAAHRRAPHAPDESTTCIKDLHARAKTARTLAFPEKRL